MAGSVVKIISITCTIPSKSTSGTHCSGSHGFVWIIFASGGDIFTT